MIGEMKCSTCGGNGNVVVNPDWPQGTEPYSEKCVECGGSGVVDGREAGPPSEEVEYRVVAVATGMVLTAPSAWDAELLGDWLEHFRAVEGKWRIEGRTYTVTDWKAVAETESRPPKTPSDSVRGSDE